MCRYFSDYGDYKHDYECDLRPRASSILATLNDIDSLGFFGGILSGKLWQVLCIRRARNVAKLADLIF